MISQSSYDDHNILCLRDIFSSMSCQDPSWIVVN
ncbi:unnamed protein product [Nezara viridula]|uniref:Uncharacterized protein n=1 Tax=Nezara viridula TaxID=85310 RepID=A0A9P0HDD6_NEZVI|nr:unnamed protein product [Nezara viridula]